MNYHTFYTWTLCQPIVMGGEVLAPGGGFLT